MKEGETMGAQVRAVGEGMGVLIEGNQEGIRRRDFEVPALKIFLRFVAILLSR